LLQISRRKRVLIHERDYLEAAGIHRVQRDLVVNRFSIHVTSSAVPKMKIRIGPEICKKNYEVSGWIFCVGALGRPEGFPGVRVGLGSAFPSVRLDLESLAFSWFASDDPANGVGTLI
jgi:hypothetical protein